MPPASRRRPWLGRRSRRCRALRRPQAPAWWPASRSRWRRGTRPRSTRQGGRTERSSCGRPARSRTPGPHRRRPNPRAGRARPPSASPTPPRSSSGGPHQQAVEHLGRQLTQVRHRDAERRSASIGSQRVMAHIAGPIPNRRHVLVGAAVDGWSCLEDPVGQPGRSSRAAHPQSLVRPGPDWLALCL